MAQPTEQLASPLAPSDVPETAPKNPGSDRVGIEEGMGGLLRPQDADYLSSDELSHRALGAFPPAVQNLYANRKIDRPATLPVDVYRTGKGATVGGYYAPDGTVVLARGNADAYHDLNVDIGGAQHELLHAIQAEVSPFADDARQGYPGLKSALASGMVSLHSDPRTKSLIPKLDQQVKADDWGHVFTELGLAYVNGIMPPAIAEYFKPMAEASPPRTQSIDPNADTPPNKREQLNTPGSWRDFENAYDVKSRMEAVARRNAVQGMGNLTQALHR